MKTRPSKLDDHAIRLAKWFGEDNITIAEAQTRLAKLGLRVSTGRLSIWWSQEQSRQMQAKMLSNIASGARFNRDLESQLEKNAPPELKTLIRLIQTLIAQLAVQNAADPDTLRLVGTLTSLVLDHDKSRSDYELRKADLDLKERRVHLLEQKAAQADATRSALSDAALTAEEKQQRIRQIFGLS